jgi:cytochrome c oxidase assembly factor CtaG
MALLLWALVGAPAAYGSGLLSAHVGQLLLCAVVVPRLLARSDALPSLPTRLADPMNAAVLLAVLLVGVYATPLLDLSQVDGSVRLLVDVLALAVGLLVTGCGPGAVRRGGRLVAVVLAGFGAGALVSPSYAAVRLESLAWEWADPGTDQAVAGLLALAVAALLVVRTGSVARYEEAGIRGS